MANENDIKLDGNILENDEEITEEINSYSLSDENSAKDYSFETLDEQNNLDEEQYDDESEEDEEVQTPKQRKTVLPVVLLGILILLFAAGVFIFIKNNNDKTSKTADSDAVPIVEISEDSVSAQNGISDAFFNENSNDKEDNNSGMMNVNFNDNGDVAVTGDGFNSENTLNKQIDTEIEQADKKTSENDMEIPDNSIKVSWDAKSRQNPFKPPVDRKLNDDKYETYGDVQFEIIEPPTKLVPDDNLTQLLKTQISGILYDTESPSAIVNLAGKDQFVKIGDEISGYRIKNITRNKVEISYRNNTYVASVGELFTPGKLEKQHAVANLTNKFAGRYKNENENIEE